ncbi:cobalt-precorrin-5B (C(1))-methyltransferase [Halorhodospira halophila]|uniref:Cobalt-precorrin-5B C(1)-methyltransferase n=1 Tax=Halorhodospira halophila (strain DSM 244 / SL1) TaxID=349124 RepID=CBID_HALHL|nr:cobalt-precorrin-5B (C(1))-methyltransferase [Halorhodospira halophila]A1WYD1.1 RecName: Full=Cobalt-precorrin-5B C(1)-methyltransferase; AltName: Full=Cobalt-precorrin-6A synthase [Halorhodospira halophila SL1]ABM62693.1 cobalamin (vitamin B12) biosynthesis CbiD protein [Halorhodospira halophila SL1]MBK1728374.1 cobalt-precorrin-5B (C(1))-methyltransferase [Halorhodospira halophila]
MSEDTSQPTDQQAGTALRRGWTTGACAAAAARAAFTGLVSGSFPDPVTIRLPRDRSPAFALAVHACGDGWARAGVIKDAGDDPDVTHGALVSVTARPGAPGRGVQLRAGPGVGTVRRSGLPVAAGEPAINPGPRGYIEQGIAEAAAALSAPTDVTLELAIEDGERLAAQTLNPRLGIEGGLSVLGTTGLLVPFSCAAWIDAIQRGIDVARAAGIEHVAGSTGRTSEQAVQAYHQLPDEALIDMGDFVGGMLKYLRRYPVPRVTIAGGVAKITKLAQGFLDVHSRRGQADLAALAETAGRLGADATCREVMATANTVAEAFDRAQAAGLPLGDAVAREAQQTALNLIDPACSEVEVLLFDRRGQRVGRAGWARD